MEAQHQSFPTETAQRVRLSQPLKSAERILIRGVAAGYFTSVVHLSNYVIRTERLFARLVHVAAPCPETQISKNSGIIAGILKVDDLICNRS